MGLGFLVTYVPPCVYDTFLSTIYRRTSSVVPPSAVGRCAGSLPTISNPILPYICTAAALLCQASPHMYREPYSWRAMSMITWL